MVEKLKLRPPSLTKRILEGLGLAEVTPADICPDEERIGQTTEKIVLDLRLHKNLHAAK